MNPTDLLIERRKQIHSLKKLSHFLVKLSKRNNLKGAEARLRGKADSMWINVGCSSRHRRSFV